MRGPASGVYVVARHSGGRMNHWEWQVLWLPHSGRTVLVATYRSEETAERICATLNAALPEETS